MTNKPECPYCSATEGLRMVNDGGGHVAPEYTCEACFTGTDDGPCFDDLRTVAEYEALLVRRWQDRLGMWSRT